MTPATATTDKCTVEALAVSEPNGPLHPWRYELPPLGPEEVDITVTHCGLGGHDVEASGNAMGLSNFPFVPGQEIIGVIKAIGPEVTKLLNEKRQKSSTTSTTAGTQTQQQPTNYYPKLEVGQRVGVGAIAFSCHSEGCHQCGYGCDASCPHVVLTSMGRLPEHELQLATKSLTAQSSKHPFLQGQAEQQSRKSTEQTPESTQQGSQQQSQPGQTQGKTPHFRSEVEEHHPGCQKFQGVHPKGQHYGGLSDVVRVHYAWVFPLPDSIPSEIAAPLLFRGAAVYAPLQMYLRYTGRGKHLASGTERAEARGPATGKQATEAEQAPGSAAQPAQKFTPRVGIVGVGALASIAVQFASAMNAEVLVFSPHTLAPDHQNRLKTMGATHVYDLNEDLKILEECYESLDLMLICSATPPTLLDPYLTLLRRNSTLVLLGFSSSPMHGGVSIHQQTASQTEQYGSQPQQYYGSQPEQQQYQQAEYSQQGYSQSTRQSALAFSRHRMSFSPDSLVLHQWSIVGSYAASRQETMDMLQFLATCAKSKEKTAVSPTKTIQPKVQVVPWDQANEAFQALREGRLGDTCLVLERSKKQEK